MASGSAKVNCKVAPTLTESETVCDESDGCVCVDRLPGESSSIRWQVVRYVRC